MFNFFEDWFKPDTALSVNPHSGFDVKTITPPVPGIKPNETITVPDAYSNTPGIGGPNQQITYPQKDWAQTLKDIAGLELPAPAQQMAAPTSSPNNIPNANRVGGSIQPPPSLMAMNAGISPMAPNPGFSLLQPRKREDWYSGGL